MSVDTKLISHNNQRTIDAEGGWGGKINPWGGIDFWDNNDHMFLSGDSVDAKNGDSWEMAGGDVMECDSTYKKSYTGAARREPYTFSLKV